MVQRGATMPIQGRTFSVSSFLLVSQKNRAKYFLLRLTKERARLQRSKEEILTRKKSKNSRKESKLIKIS
jgi:hypothetical protein